MTKALTPEQWAEKRARSAQSDLDRRRAYYQANKERISERTRAYAKTEKAKAQMRAYQQKPEVKERRALKQAERVASTSAEMRAAHAAYRKAWKTGVPIAVFHEMKDKQNGLCGVCQNPLGDFRIHTDHCHETGLIRGLLCQACNTTEGRIRKLGLSPLEFANRLHDYLLRPPAADMGLFWPKKPLD